MTIVRLRAWVTRTPLRAPVTWTVGGIEDAAHHLWVELTDAGGARGLSETPVKPAWTGLDGPAALAALRHVIWPRLAGATTQTAAKAIAGVRVLLALEAAVGHALEDLAGEREATSAELVIVLTRDAPERLAEAACAAVRDLGVSILKVKAGQGLEADAMALKLARHALGSDGILMVDANSAYDVDAGRELCRLSADQGAAFVEDPWPLSPDARTGDAVAACGCAVAADRAADRRDLVEGFIDRGIGWIAVKPNRVGPLVARAMAAAARARGARCVSGLFGEGPLGALQQLRGPTGDIGVEAGFHLGLVDPVPVRGLVVGRGAIGGPAGRASDLVRAEDIARRATDAWEGTSRGA